MLEWEPTTKWKTTICARVENIKPIPNILRLSGNKTTRSTVPIIGGGAQGLSSQPQGGGARVGNNNENTLIGAQVETNKISDGPMPFIGASHRWSCGGTLYPAARKLRLWGPVGTGQRNSGSSPPAGFREVTSGIDMDVLDVLLEPTADFTQLVLRQKRAGRLWTVGPGQWGGVLEGCSGGCEAHCFH